METLWDPPPTNLTCAPFSSMDTSLMTSVCVVFERVIRYSDPLRIFLSFMVQEPEHTAESSTVKVASSPTCALQFTRPVFTDAVGSEQINLNIFTGIHWFKTVYFSLNMKTVHNNTNNNKKIFLTKIKCSRNLQVGTLTKIIDRWDAELIACFFWNVTDGVFSARHRRTSDFNPGLGSHLPALKDIASNGHRPFTVWWRPAQCDRWICLVPHHWLNRGIWGCFLGAEVKSL